MKGLEGLKIGYDIITGTIQTATPKIGEIRMKIRQNSVPYP